MGSVAAISEGPAQWAMYAVAGLTIVYLAFIRPLRIKKKPAAAAPGPRMSLAQERSLEQEMSGLLVELTDMTRQISAQLDNRAAKLEALIEDADQRIATLRALQSNGADGERPDGNRADGSTAGPGGAAEDSRWAVKQAKAADAAATQSSADLLAALRGMRGGATATAPRGEEPAARPLAAQAASAARSDVDRRHAPVYALADEGKPPAEIAQRLGRPLGEIELILALRGG